MRIKAEHHAMILDMASHSEVEICGLLSESLEGEPADMYALENASGDPIHSYEVRAIDQFTAMRRIQNRDTVMAAIYHSHPKGPPRPSETDIQRAFYPDVTYLIAGRIGYFDDWTLMGYRIRDGVVTIEPIEIA